MIHYKRENLPAAIRDMAHMPHMEVLNKYLPEILLPDTDNSFSSCGKPDFRAAVYNMETGNRLHLILPYLTCHPKLKDLDIILANEVDRGMARSGNSDSVREIAEKLGMNYAFGTEFLTADAFRKGNEDGLGGNAIFSRYPLSHVKIIHLPIEYDWFYREGDCRLGVRIAVAAEIKAGTQNILICCVHLDNRISPAGRACQTEYLLRELKKEYGEMPALIGGDMNTNTVDGDALDGYRFIKDREEQLKRIAEIPRWEPLMDLVKAYGFRYDNCNLQSKVTRRKPDPSGDMLLNLDWFFSRSLKCDGPCVVKSVFDHTELENGEEFRQYDGALLSDHDAVVIHCGPEDITS